MPKGPNDVHDSPRFVRDTAEARQFVDELSKKSSELHNFLGQHYWAYRKLHKAMTAEA